MRELVLKFRRESSQRRRIDTFRSNSQQLHTTSHSTPLNQTPHRSIDGRKSLSYETLERLQGHLHFGRHFIHLMPFHDAFSSLRGESLTDLMSRIMHAILVPTMVPVIATSVPQNNARAGDSLGYSLYFPTNGDSVAALSIASARRFSNTDGSRLGVAAICFPAPTSKIDTLSTVHLDMPPSLTG